MINQNIYEKTDLVRVTYFVNIIFINNIKLQLGPYQNPQTQIVIYIWYVAKKITFGITYFVAFLFLFLFLFLYLYSQF